MTLVRQPTTGAVRRPRRVRRWVLLVVVLGLLLPLVVAGLLQVRLAGQVDRIDGAFAGLTDRPTRPAQGPGADALDLLVLTTDRSAQAAAPDAVRAPGWSGAAHVDSVMMLHFDGDRRAATSVTVPLSTPVALPIGSKDSGRLGSVLPRSTAAGLVGGIERLTDVRVDHLVVLDWAGLSALVARGGSIEAPDPTGNNGSRVVLDASETLDYARGDMGAGEGTSRRQEYLIRAVLDASLHQELAREPWALYSLLDTLTRHLAVESGWSSSQMRDLVISLRHMRSYSIGYVTAPPASGSLWRAVRDDDLASWSRDHPDAVLPFATG